MSGKMSFIANTVASFIISILSGLGVGSGGLLVAYLSASGQGTGELRGINLFFFILSAVSASLFNIKVRRFNPPLIFTMSSFGIIGCLIGTYVGQFIQPHTLKIIFGVMLTSSGIYVLFSDSVAKTHKKDLKK